MVATAGKLMGEGDDNGREVGDALDTLRAEETAHRENAARCATHELSFPRRWQGEKGGEKGVGATEREGEEETARRGKKTTRCQPRNSRPRRARRFEILKFSIGGDVHAASTMHPRSKTAVTAVALSLPPSPPSRRAPALPNVARKMVADGTCGGVKIQGGFSRNPDDLASPRVPKSLLHARTRARAQVTARARLIADFGFYLPEMGYRARAGTRSELDTLSVSSHTPMAVDALPSPRLSCASLPPPAASVCPSPPPPPPREIKSHERHVGARGALPANPATGCRPAGASYWSPVHRVRRECPVNRSKSYYDTLSRPRWHSLLAAPRPHYCRPALFAALALAPMILRIVHSSLARAEERG